MASYANRKPNRFEIVGTPDNRQSSAPPAVSPAKMDEMLLDALDALEQTQKLHETTPNPETKRQVSRILMSLQSALAQLAPLGVHSLKRLARMAP